MLYTLLETLKNNPKISAQREITTVQPAAFRGTQRAEGYRYLQVSYR